MAQTKDGYLWLGTQLGLFRFDGSRFSKIPYSPADPDLPQQGISALSADAQGGLWIAYTHGAIISHLAGGLVTHFTIPGEQRDASTDFIQCCHQESLWVIANNSIMRLHNVSWEDYGALHGLPNDYYFTLYFDRQNNLWASSRHHIYVLHAGATRFTEVNTVTFSVTRFAESKDGTLWISDAWRGVRPLDANCGEPYLKLTGAANMLMDASDQLWLGRDYKGVTRTSAAAFACNTVADEESYRVPQGLSSDVTLSLLRDSDGSVWVGTDKGLDRFRQRTFTLFNKEPIKYYPAVAVASDGGVWVASQGKEVVRFARGGSLLASARRYGSSPLAADTKGGVWLRDPWDHLMHHFDAGAKEDRSFATPNHLADTAAQSILVEDDGAILVAFEANGLWRYAKQWDQMRRADLPADTPTCLVKAGGAIWIGYASDKLASIEHGVVRLFEKSDGLAVDTVLTLKIANGTTWVGGSNGIAFLSAGRFIPLLLDQPEFARGVSGLVFDEGGNLWVNGGAGVAMVGASELKQALSNPLHAVSASLYGEADGIQGTPAQVKPLPSAWADGTGRLWFATAGNLVYLLPGALAKQRSPISVGIVDILVNGKSVAVPVAHSRRLELLGGSDSRVEFDYAAADLSTPLQVKYRYMLDGEDAWQFVGTRRQAFYERLRPGSYTFRVAVTSGDGKWHESTQPLYLLVKPAFYQTIWFAALCLIATSLLIWGLYSVRIRSVTLQIQSRLQERADERVRIARELHDTLLQSVHGLLLRFHYAAEALEETNPALPRLRVAIDRADAVIKEGRDKVKALRGGQSEVISLWESLKCLAGEINELGGPAVHVAETGTRKAIEPSVAAEILEIMREAAWNASAHAAASRIDLNLIYKTRTLKINCCDDGVGIPNEILRSGGKEGHWGIVGMKERAAAAGAKLSITSPPGQGTCVQLELRALRAYIPTRWRKHFTNARIF